MVRILILYIGRLKKNFSAFFEVGRGTGNKRIGHGAERRAQSVKGGQVSAVREWGGKVGEGRHKKISNVEEMYSACRELLCRTVYLKKTEQSESTLRNSPVRYSAVLRFAV